MIDLLHRRAEPATHQQAGELLDLVSDLAENRGQPVRFLGDQFRLPVERAVLPEPILDYFPLPDLFNEGLRYSVMAEQRRRWHDNQLFAEGELAKFCFIQSETVARGTEVTTSLDYRVIFNFGRLQLERGLHADTVVGGRHILVDYRDVESNAMMEKLVGLNLVGVDEAGLVIDSCRRISAAL